MANQDPSQAAQGPSAASAFWDGAAPGFDAEPDHGLHVPEVHRAWTELLRTYLPPPPASVLDLGCGTGSLSVLLAELGHAVTGIDFSAAMREFCVLGQAGPRRALHPLRGPALTPGCCRSRYGTKSVSRTSDAWNPAPTLAKRLGTRQ